MKEIMTVPANIREEFDTSKINTGMNTIEELLKDEQLLADEPYIPTPDERTLNVVQRIKETSKFYQEDNKSVGGFTNVWEYKEDMIPTAIDTESSSQYDHYTYRISDYIDPTLLLGAIGTTVSGETHEVQEIPPIEGIFYTILLPDVGHSIRVLTESIVEEDTYIPAGMYLVITVAKEGNTLDSGIVKIIATSNIFPIQ